MSELINKLNQYRSMGDKLYPEDILVIEDVWELLDEIERLNNIINELDKQNGELGADLSIIKDTIDKTNWWLEQMLKQATNNETKAIISGALELLLGSDKE